MGLLGKKRKSCCYKNSLAHKDDTSRNRKNNFPLWIDRKVLKKDEKKLSSKKRDGNMWGKK